MWWILLIVLSLTVLAFAVLLMRARTTADAVARQNLQLAQDRQRLFDFMHHMTEALGEGLSRQELHQRIVHASILSTGALSACFFEQTERGTMRGVAVEGLFPPHRPLSDALASRLGTRAKFVQEVLKSEEFPVSEGIVGRVARTRRGELLADARSDPRIVKHEDPALAVRSVIVMPLQFRERFFGVLAVTNPAGDQLFGEADFTLIQSLAEQAGLALHNAAFLDLQLEKRQLDLDLSIASGIQQMLLPREAVRLPGLELDARFQPAQRVGGDFYDAIPLSTTRLGVVLADVAGKGIPASLLMAICRTSMRHIAPRFSSPRQALLELNRTLAPDLQAGLYVTMIYAIIDVVTHQVTLARAGHELPLFVRAEPGGAGPRESFAESEGMALGMVPDDILADALVDHVEPFNPTDVLVLYTDGITEAPNEEGKEFSGARLAEVVREHHQSGPIAINDRILEAVGQFGAGAQQRDDFTLLTVKRTSGSA